VTGHRGRVLSKEMVTGTGESLTRSEKTPDPVYSTRHPLPY
jgi:hypothetical protein